MPTAVDATIKQYVSVITSMDDKEILPKIVNIENNYGFTDVMNAFGRYEPSKMYLFESFTNTPLWKTGEVESVTGSPTTTGTIVLTAATSGNRRKNDVIMFTNGKNARVTNVTNDGTQDTIVFQSVDGTNITVTGGDLLKFYTNAVGERSISRKSLFNPKTRRYNLIQIFRDTHTVSDVQMLSKTTVPESGNYTVFEYAEMWMKLKAEVNAAFFASTISAAQFNASSPALTDPEGGGQTQTTRGLNQYIESLGVKDTVASSGTWTLDGDCYDIIDSFLANKADSNYSIFGASSPLAKIDNHMKGLGSAGVVQSARMNMDGRSLSFTVQSWEYKGFNFQKYRMPILDQPELFGGTHFQKALWYMPEGKTKIQNSEGYSTYAPFMRVRYIKQPLTVANKGSDIWGEIHSGPYSEINPSGDRAEAKAEIITHQGLEVLGAEHFGRQYVFTP